MDTIFINTENSKTNEPQRFRLYFTNKLDLRRRKNNTFQVQHGQKPLIYQMDLMKYPIFKIIF